MFAINYAQDVPSHFVEGKCFVVDALKGGKMGNLTSCYPWSHVSNGCGGPGAKCTK